MHATSTQWAFVFYIDATLFPLSHNSQFPFKLVKPRSAALRLPDFVEPMKAKLVGSMPVGAWIYEIKYDGYRALALRAGGETRILCTRHTIRTCPGGCIAGSGVGVAFGGSFGVKKETVRRE